MLGSWTPKHWHRCQVSYPGVLICSNQNYFTLWTLLGDFSFPINMIFHHSRTLSKVAWLRRFSFLGVINATREKYQTSSQISCQSHNYYAELTGIEIGLTYIKDNMDPLPRSILLISDCISALKACFCGKVTDRFNRVIMSIKEVVCFFGRQGHCR